jgi:hypothetical protein
MEVGLSQMVLGLFVRILIELFMLVASDKCPKTEDVS